MYDKQPNNSNPGAPHVGVTQQAQRPSGMPCPQCSGFIPVSMQQIIRPRGILTKEARISNHLKNSKKS